jgi:hypothetical protein
MTQDEAQALLGYQIEPGWTVHEVRRAGALAGFILQKGCEVHAWRSPLYRGCWLSSRVLQRVLEPIVREFGAATTKVRAHNATGHASVQRLGFEQTGEQGGCVLYAGRRFKHARL